MKRAARVTLAAGLAAMTLPASQAAASPAPSTGETQLGGFAASSIATPIRVEIWEPLVPIPAEPQAELNIAYSKALSTSGPASKGRASWLWPGDPVGEGFKVFVEQLGLPKELGERGYPVQVNSEYPSDNQSASDEPVPGMVMRTSADAETTVSKAGFSTTGDLEDGDDKKGDKGKGGEEPPGVPGLPGLPGAPGLPGLPSGDTAAAEEPAPAPLGALSALVTADAVNGVSKTTYGTDTIVSSAVTRIHGLSLLDGVITADTVRVLSRTTSTLTTSKNENDVTVEGLAIGGTPFGINDEGVVVSDSKQDIPGLPDEASEALAELGVSFTLPSATKSSEGGTGSQEVRGLQVAIDFSALRSRFDSGPVDGIIAQLPDDLGKLKAALGATTQAQPNVVIVLGEAQTEAATVPPIDYEAPPTDDPTTEPPAGGGGGTGGAGAGSTGGTGGTGTSTGSTGATDSVPTNDTLAGPVESTEVAVQPTASGLPPLGSVPGALLIGALLLAGGLGWWIQKIGGSVLGGSASCAHGLSSGVPDLRKA